MHPLSWGVKNIETGEREREGSNAIMATFMIDKTMHGHVMRANDNDTLVVTLTETPGNEYHWYLTSGCPGTLFIIAIAKVANTVKFTFRIRETPTTLRLEHRRPMETTPDDIFTVEIV
jgi:hypothetical protein